MATKHKVTVSTYAPRPRPTSLERRQALYEQLATAQQDLRREAEERRARRAQNA